MSDTGTSLGRPGREISSDHASELVRLATHYWWYAVRLEHVEAVLVRLPRPFRYLDFGCGGGVLTRHLIERFAPSEALGVDGTDEAVDAARARGVPVAYADFREAIELPFRPEVVTSLDVLEHLENPVAALGRLAEGCAPGATLIVTVPAMPSLTSRWDELSGHYRRYTPSLLQRHLDGGGWRPRRIRHFFSFAVPPAWIERRLLRRVREFEFPRVSRPANALLTTLGRLERRLGSPLPFGTSLFAVAVRA